jgi:hypothetical protein
MSITHPGRPPRSDAAQAARDAVIRPRILAALAEYGPLPEARVNYHLGYRDVHRIRRLLAELVADGRLTAAVGPWPCTTSVGGQFTIRCRLYRLPHAHL